MYRRMGKWSPSTHMKVHFMMMSGLRADPQGMVQVAATSISASHLDIHPMMGNATCNWGLLGA
jgi:hypothetical protein